MSLSFSTNSSNPDDLSHHAGGGRELRQALEVKPPSGAQNAPPILTLERKRDVDIPWHELNRRAPIAALQEHFESSWNVANIGSLWSNPDRPFLGDRIHVLSPTEPFYRTNFKLSDFAESLTKGFAIRFGDGIRWYLLVERPENPLSGDDFLTFAKYQAAWNEKIEGIELVFKESGAARTNYSEFREIDLRPALIARRYQELTTLRKYARDVKQQVGESAKKALSSRITSNDLNGNDIESIQQRALQLEMGDYDVQRKIDKLVADSARLGYLLADQDRDVALPDGRKVKLTEGKLYTAYNTTLSWTEYVSVKPHWYSRRSTQSISRAQTALTYQEVDLTQDAVGEQRAAWLAAGKIVFLFEKTPTGFVASDGTSLRQVMDLCLQDEDFRCRCIVLLPVIEESLTGARVLTKYAAFLRPMPGVIPASIPRLALVESLSYRTAWAGTHVGELVSTINLGPGEERQVKITRTSEKVSSVSHTSTSIFDVSRAETNDLATEMENQTRREQEHSSSMECSAKASGSYMGVTAEASARAGTTSSLKDFGQAISKVAKKAAQSVTQQNKQDVSTSSSTSTKDNNTDETVAALRNINQGRALNLLFFRLYNRFEGGLYLDGLRFEVLTGIESIAGSGVQEARSYALEELSEVVNALRTAGLRSQIGENEFGEKVANCVSEVIEREYAEPAPQSPLNQEIATAEEIDQLRRSVTYALAGDGSPPAIGAVDRLDSVATAPTSAPAARVMTSVGRLLLPSRDRGNVDSSPLDFSQNVLAAVPVQKGNPLTRESGTLASLALALRSAVVLRHTAIEPLTLLLPAGGMYLDTSVGVQPATEPYSERMRDEEVRLKQAEVYRKTTEGFLNQAQATARIAGSDSAQHATGSANRVTGALVGADRRSVVISLLHPLRAGTWTLQVNGSTHAEIDSTYVGQQLLQVTFKNEQPWLLAPNLAAQLSLVEEVTAERVQYLSVAQPQS